MSDPKYAYPYPAQGLLFEMLRLTKIGDSKTTWKLRVCHKLTEKLKREVVLGSSSIDDPPQFIMKLKLMTAHELSLDDLQI